MIVLTQIATLDNWTSYFYTIIFGCAAQPSPLQFQDIQCVASEPQFLLGTIYFVVFTIFGSYVLLALFVGAIYLGMEEEGKAQSEEERVQECILNIQRSHVDLDLIAIAKYHKAFKLLDITFDNRLGKEELRFGILITEEDFEADDFENLWAIMDIDGSNEVDFSEFILFALELRKMKLAEEEAQKNNNRMRKAISKVTGLSSHTKVVSLSCTLRAKRADLEEALRATHSHHYAQLTPNSGAGSDSTGNSHNNSKKKRRKNSSICRSDESQISVNDTFEVVDAMQLVREKSIGQDLVKPPTSVGAGPGPGGGFGRLTPPPIVEGHEHEHSSDDEEQPQPVGGSKPNPNPNPDSTENSSETPSTSPVPPEEAVGPVPWVTKGFDRKSNQSGKFTANPTQVHPITSPKQLETTLESTLETASTPVKSPLRTPLTPQPPSGMKTNALLRPATFVRIPFIAGEHDHSDNDSDCGELP